MKHKITKQSYDYECSDGCCSEYGTKWAVDGKEVYSGPLDDEAIFHILIALGIEAEIVGLDESGEEVWTL